MLLVFLYLVILEYNIVVNGVFNIYKYSIKFMDLNMIDICDGINNIGVFGWFFQFDVCVVVVELSLFQIENFFIYVCGGVQYEVLFFLGLYRLIFVFSYVYINVVRIVN